MQKTAYEMRISDWSSDVGSSDLAGDLSRKKLMPAVYDLATRGLPPPGFALVGFARRDWEDQDFAQVVHAAVKQYARTEFRDETGKELPEGLRVDRKLVGWGPSVSVLVDVGGHRYIKKKKK